MGNFLGNTKTKEKTKRMHRWMEIISIFHTLNTLLQALLPKLTRDHWVTAICTSTSAYTESQMLQQPPEPKKLNSWPSWRWTTLRSITFRFALCLGQAYLSQLCQLIPPTYHFYCHCKLVHSPADVALYFKLAATIFWHFQNTIFCGSTAGPSQSEV